MSQQRYAWIGSDGGWKIGLHTGEAFADRAGVMLQMQHYHDPARIEWVPSHKVRFYPATPIEEATP